MISVVIRTKNQSKALEFLLSNLKNRYSNDIDEVIVVDNLSEDNSKEIAVKYNARFETITNFSYGGSANFCAEKAKNEIIVIFSAHAYPVSPDFFSTIKKQFEQNKKLAGVRCLHSSNDYENYIINIPATQDPNKSGLIFSGSAFRKSTWDKIKFNENVPTFEDKDWTKRVLKAGYDIEFAPVVFNYRISRNDKQKFFRFKNDLIGNYQIWHTEPKLINVTKGTLVSIINAFKVLFISIYYAFKRFFLTLKFKLNKPKKFEY
ncbi:glycosyltransferase [Algibacter amylolyticus]|uniref:Glycosyltransferase n=1 Tax=Algibacter amylolyticus TaxID=1608400 RepID=A0A5M7B577_9FLAO|nr:glycosyltransferase [Algibacter amylolyticus]KAA5822445.1 glycosyltransferase [Algibacter amylolyticus]MBB5269168.1 glycosyltransferase involved in cell wall biosynthesis [Algibacter amylolyticus]TSJ73595.1 glycosyltransferase [Algibacter amylolyticus]